MFLVLNMKEFDTDVFKFHLIHIDYVPKIAITVLDSIAPCGMNCALCMAFTREKNTCMGCNGIDENKPYHCVKCSIKNCEFRENGKLCDDCLKYPCTRLKQLDKRYRSKYHMSMIQNLNEISRTGLESFIEKENARWVCPRCGKLLCVHRSDCIHCGNQIDFPPIGLETH